MTIADGSATKVSIARIDELVTRLQVLPESPVRILAIDLVQAVMNLHAEAIDRMLEIVSDSAATALPQLGADPLVSAVLALHGLHPDDFETRFARVADKLREYFDSRGAGIEVLERSPALVRLHFQGKRPASAPAARQMIEDAIYEATPEVTDLIIEGLEEEAEGGFVPLSSLMANQTA
jgi:hypothetical protein